MIDSVLVGSTKFSWEGSRERRRCSRDTYSNSYITEYTSVHENKVSQPPATKRCEIGAGLGRDECHVRAQCLFCQADREREWDKAAGSSHESATFRATIAGGWPDELRGGPMSSFRGKTFWIFPARPGSHPHLLVLPSDSAVERMWHTYASPAHILALAFR